jgi:hypothetical protein
MTKIRRRQGEVNSSKCGSKNDSEGDDVKEKYDVNDVNFMGMKDTSGMIMMRATHIISCNTFQCCVYDDLIFLEKKLYGIPTSELFSLQGVEAIRE